MEFFFCLKPCWPFNKDKNKDLIYILFSFILFTKFNYEFFILSIFFFLPLLDKY